MSGPVESWVDSVSQGELERVVSGLSRAGTRRVVLETRRVESGWSRDSSRWNSSSQGGVLDV